MANDTVSILHMGVVHRGKVVKKVKLRRVYNDDIAGTCTAMDHHYRGVCRVETHTRCHLHIHQSRERETKWSHEH